MKIFEPMKFRQKMFSEELQKGRLVILSLLLAAAISAIVPLSAQAQETGSILCNVTDPTGARVPNASVTIKSASTGTTRTATTSSEGFFIVTNLQPGVYDVTVKATGFGVKVTQVNVTVGAKVTFDVQLAVSEIAAGVVDVVANAGVEVNTAHQELSSVVSSKQISELPTLTRNPYDLVAISGNGAQDPSGSTMNRGANFAINGMRAASTNILLDGADNNNTFTASVGQRVPLDSVQEFRVITSNFSAEYGRASGGIVNVATKAGTNSFHGTVFDFNRVAALASNGFENNAQGNEKGGFTRNQFGYSLGGPIKKDKLHFFSSTEWTRVRSGAPTINMVPTPQLIAASNPGTQAFFANYKLARPINGKILTVKNVVDSFRKADGSLDPDTAAALGQFLALPGNLPAFGETRFSLPANQGAGDPQNSYQTVARVDWNLSERTQIYGRYALESQNFFAGTVNYNPYDGFDTGQTNYNNNLLLSVTRTFTPNLVSQSKITYNRLNNLQPLGSQSVGPTLYLTGGSNTQIGSQLLSFPGYSQFTPGNAIPFGGPQNIGQVSEDVNWNKGKHQFRFGGQFVYIQDNRAFGAYQNATEQLGTNIASGLNNFVQGQLTIFQAAVFPQGKFPGDTLTLPVAPPDFTRSNRYRDLGFYGNDSWRVKPRLTFNLGLRWEYFGVQHNKDPKKDSNFYFGSGSTLQERIRNGKVMLAQDSPVGSLWQKDFNNFAPRVGFALDLFGDGKTSIRGGYGIAYERNFGNVTFNVIQNPPNYAVVSLSVPDVPSLPITSSNAGPLAGSSGSKVLPVTSLRWVRPDIVTAYSHFYSVAFQRELFSRTVVSAEYTGSAGEKLYSLENYNRNGFGTFYLGSPAARPPAIGGTTSRLNGQYSNINERGNGGYSRFNALILGLESSNFRGRGLQLTAKYRYSVARDNLSSTFSDSVNNNNLGLLDPFNNKLDYGYADFDFRHSLSVGYNWELPFAKNTKGFARQILDGWSLNGIYTATSGAPFTVFDCSNGLTVCIRMVPTGPFKTSGSGNPKDTGDPNNFNFIDLSNQTPSSFKDISGNTEVGPYPANMTARNAFRGPGFWNLDTGIYKKFFVTERYQLQFRAEMYNTFNHANLYVNTNQTDISSFNYVPASRGIRPFVGALPERRNIQMALKLIF